MPARSQPFRRLCCGGGITNSGEALVATVSPPCTGDVDRPSSALLSPLSLVEIGTTQSTWGDKLLFPTIVVLCGRDSMDVFDATAASSVAWTTPQSLEKKHRGASTKSLDDAHLRDRQSYHTRVRLPATPSGHVEMGGASSSLVLVQDGSQLLDFPTAHAWSCKSGGNFIPSVDASQRLKRSRLKTQQEHESIQVKDRTRDTARIGIRGRVLVTCDVTVRRSIDRKRMHKAQNSKLSTSYE
ncbi:uncharacterized protein LAESUDRAFT_717248 [Laetiporus sulphureus 93-53]|uniref:Uncharacterized protein n=1 Tax=Laetiporus sulphureus 93-53 TaxID=1314785 RepID=A0A165BZ76_9APHY|nr:uncharacterized protein LAESUDRAFT_717248 [Laetiporus sulphureus 93-53]KZT01917.1 hypothetical protein LAESUDRAFT_717248 [Laetiporus sulphureus 93-53]